MTNKIQLKDVLAGLPQQPGIYKYFDEDKNILYVGKAKNLKKRVNSYFSKQHDNRKTAVLVSKINQIEYTVVDTEMDALLLENSLIKEFQPRYNINLKDDKTYPLIKITKERFPKVYAMRNPVNDGAEYFGPYASVRVMHIVLDLVKQLYPTRNCSYQLSQKNIEAHKFKVCLEYQIGNCKGACEGLESEKDYLESIQNIKHILKGNLSEVKNHLKQLMQTSSEALKFEEAQRYKFKLDLLEKFQSKSTVVSHHVGDVDVFNISIEDKFAFVNFLRVVNGIIIQTRTLEFKKILDESKEEILEVSIAEIQSQYGIMAKELVLPFEIDLAISNVKITIPKAGEKLKLLELSKKNAYLYKKERINLYEKLNPDLRIDRLMNKMKEDLRLTELPRHIECFDNSNIQGEYAVSACVVFKDGKPAKKDYRHFNVQTVDGPNDFATMIEALTRRYTRLINENEPLPQLLVVDGGKGQLSSAVEALKSLGIYGKMAVIGIAKRLEEIYFPFDPLPIYIDKKSETLKVIQQMRDEAHRFGITHHRNKRSKGSLASELDVIKGIGPETKKQLFTFYKSIKKIKETPLADLQQTIGLAKAKIIFNHFNS
jgi:excinuclease ABC subunit C